MSLESRIEALESYREQLGDEIVDFFSKLWARQDELSTSAPLDRLRESILFLDDYSPGLRDATEAVYTDQFVLEVPDKVTGESVERLIEDIAQMCGLDPASDLASNLSLAVICALRPEAQKAALCVEQPDKASVQTGECPCCGVPAALGIMRDDGQAAGSSRMLWCTLCENTWEFPRIRCARCGSSRQEDLEFFFVEGDSGHRIYGCAECKGTLKVVNEADLKRRCDPRVEELVLEELLDAVIEGSALPDAASIEIT